MAAEDSEQTAPAKKTGAPAKKRGVGRPRRIDPETIVATARRILEAEGVAGLSMRRVAKEVGTTPMALYHHVRDKDELLMLTLAGTAATVPRPELPDDPRDRLLAVSLHMHGTLARMPWVVEVLSLGDLTDEGALWMVEEIIACGIACGLTPEEAVRAYRTIWHCVYGDLAFRHAMERRAEDPGRKRHFPDLLADVDATELPHLAALAGRWSELTEDYDVTGQLGAVVDGLLGRPRSVP
ncbi:MULTISPECIES: TetR/AcrR family transcriptional regulator [Streptomyces]|uniref:TetR/AcrR family transcriptional regulator n=1 Tax=Streptomyces venezuelae TaxID=54571 RepID=A0A5P2BKK7_STRVZ|nr:TetR/AcrR family transcriptional regulator [Streptomyces venezuelae]MYY84608.1 TetR family transcriptional regulator [Streptomyces sp. SID335]MYZ14468.1 TetR family transcriptional regulator [Streptomyces sp. SID337]NDZ88906.1 TetR/AcrR family transcriptional regulator [Streptomyces sp. SID10115]NDZ99779.1 TetR/AcrR family transcriptional regulator [Streptomyces sp. SID10116]NEB49007.1 TetR/AcrR family transcriptional regulator [Streptomyces sp. SID339]